MPYAGRDQQLLSSATPLGRYNALAENMRRYYLKLGDQSTSGGKVVEAVSSCYHNGTPLTFLGAQVYCPACKRTGRIIPNGPRWPDHMMDKVVALEGDLCSCGCSPPPRMLASQHDMSQDFDAKDMVKMGFTASGMANPENPMKTSGHWISFALQEPGCCEGLRCRAHFTDGSVEDGVVDQNNSVRFMRQNSMSCEKLEILFTDADAHPISMTEILLGQLGL